MVRMRRSSLRVPPPLRLRLRLAAVLIICCMAMLGRGLKHVLSPLRIGPHLRLLSPSPFWSRTVLPNSVWRLSSSVERVDAGAANEATPAKRRQSSKSKLPVTPVSAMTLEQAREELTALDVEIDAHDGLYYEQGAPIITDAAYDKLVRRAEDLEGKFEELRGLVRHLQRVGLTRNAKFGPFSHARRLLSLDNALNLDEVAAFVAKCEAKLALVCTERPNFVVEPKIDGLSLAIHYEGGRFAQAGTRGDGSVGENVTNNARLVQGVPQDLPTGVLGQGRGAHVEVRGEAYISVDDFRALNVERAEQGDNLFSTPRNAAAGSLRQLNGTSSRSRNLRFFAYALFVDGEPLSSQDECLSQLGALGFAVAQPWRLCCGVDEVLAQCRAVSEARAGLGYDTDGAVVKVCSTAQQEALGSLPRFPRWAVAYKFVAEEAETELLTIQVQVGRTGVLTPVAHLRPVTIGGVQVERATLHNEEEVRRLGLRPGLRIRLKRAGDVIPKVVGLGVGESASSVEGEAFTLPCSCPVCGSRTEREEGGVLVRCTGGVACSAQAIEQIRHFSARDAADIEGLGAATAEELYKDGLLRSPADIFSLRRRDLEGDGSGPSLVGQLRSKKGWGNRSVNKLLAAIDAKRELPMLRFLFALGVRHVGQETSRLLAAKFRSFAALWSYLQAEAGAETGAGAEAPKEAVGQALLDIEGIGPRAAATLLDLARNARSAAVVEELLREVRVLDYDGPALVEGGASALRDFDRGSLTGQTVVFTGRFKRIARKDAEAFCERQGATVGKSVTASTTLLVEAVAEGAAGQGKLSTKAKKARALGVEVMGEDEFVQLYRFV